MLKDIFGSLGFVIVGSDILFWAYFFIMDKVSVFESSDFGELRIIVDPKGDVWFVASDVAKSLGYINAKDAVKRHVDDDDSMLLQVSDNQWGVKRSILKTRYIDSIRIIIQSYVDAKIVPIIGHKILFLLIVNYFKNNIPILRNESKLLNILLVSSCGERKLLW